MQDGGVDVRHIMTIFNRMKADLVRGTVSDATFEAAQAHFNEVELVELAWLAAAETYFNIQSHIFDLQSDGLAERPL